MIASALIAITAVAVYPIFARTKSSSKFGDARQMCENIVRGKLDQYRNGLPVNLTQEGARPYPQSLDHRSGSRGSESRGGRKICRVSLRKV
jgi:hypothetical protein